MVKVKNVDFQRFERCAQEISDAKQQRKNAMSLRLLPLALRP